MFNFQHTLKNPKFLKSDNFFNAKPSSSTIKCFG